jgi:hypothetical protein
MPFFGKYRGKVKDNKDPLQLGRLQVSVPAIFGDGRLSWAMPCSPFAGNKIGFFALPPVDSNIWVEFEAGDPDYPIWSGCFWGDGEVPAEPATEDLKIFKTDSITMTFHDKAKSGGFTLEVASPVSSVPLKIIMNSSGIEIKNDKSSIKLTDQGIEINSPPGKIKMAQEGIEVESSPGKVKMSSSGIDLSNGSSSIKLSPSSVNVNNGALEVT